MKCFNHAETDAVDFCKSCGRGLCRDCACDVSGIASCKGQCETDIQKRRALLRQAEDMHKTLETLRKPPRQPPTRTALLMGLAAAAFLGSGLFFVTQRNMADGGYVCLLIGFVSALVWIFMLRRKRKAAHYATQQPTPDVVPASSARKCFNHPAIECIGVCRNCGRTLCRNCAAEVSGRLCCKGQCEKEIARWQMKLRFARHLLFPFLKFMVAVLGKVRWAIAIAAAFCIGMGIRIYLHPAPNQDYGPANGLVLVGTLLGCRFVWLVTKSRPGPKEMPGIVPPILPK